MWHYKIPLKSYTYISKFYFHFFSTIFNKPVENRSNLHFFVYKSIIYVAKWYIIWREKKIFFWLQTLVKFRAWLIWWKFLNTVLTPLIDRQIFCQKLTYVCICKYFELKFRLDYFYVCKSTFDKVSKLFFNAKKRNGVKGRIFHTWKMHVAVRIFR